MNEATGPRASTPDPRQRHRRLGHRRDRRRTQRPRQRAAPPERLRHGRPSAGRVRPATPQGRSRQHRSRRAPRGTEAVGRAPVPVSPTGSVSGGTRVDGRDATGSVAGGGGGRGGGGASLSAEELAAAAGLDVERGARAPGVRPARAVPGGRRGVLRRGGPGRGHLAGRFARFGIEPRHLRLYKNAADREAGFVEQIVLPLVRQRNPEARARAHETADELARLGQQLRGPRCCATPWATC